MRALVYTTAALDDLAVIAAYIAEESGSRAVAEAFVSRLTERCVRLAALPGALGQARPELGREIRSVPHQGYVIFFRYVGETVEIIDVLEGHRDIDDHFSR